MREDRYSVTDWLQGKLRNLCFGADNLIEMRELGLVSANVRSQIQRTAERSFDQVTESIAEVLWLNYNADLICIRHERDREEFSAAEVKRISQLVDGDISLQQEALKGRRIVHRFTSEYVKIVQDAYTTIFNPESDEITTKAALQRIELAFPQANDDGIDSWDLCTMYGLLKYKHSLETLKVRDAPVKEAFKKFILRGISVQDLQDFYKVLVREEIVDSEKTAQNDFIQVLSSDLSTTKAKIYFNCKTVEAAYILHSIQGHWKNMNWQNLGDSERFVSKLGNTLTSRNLTKAYSDCHRVDFNNLDRQQTLDEIAASLREKTVT